MPVRKFRSIEAMDAAGAGQGAEPPEVRWKAVALVLAVADAGAPRRLVPGVYKHRTVAEWNAQTDAWEAQAVAQAEARVQGTRG